MMITDSRVAEALCKRPVGALPAELMALAIVTAVSGLLSN